MLTNLLKKWEVRFFSDKHGHWPCFLVLIGPPVVNNYSFSLMPLFKMYAGNEKVDGSYYCVEDSDDGPGAFRLVGIHFRVLAL